VSIILKVNYFDFSINNASKWILSMAAYLFISVIPQEFIYRVVFFYRYRKVFKSAISLFIVSAMLFSFVHIVYHNIHAVMLTFFGGLLFASTYYKYNSYVLSVAEHFVYGLILYASGYGSAFFE
jgi:membrane protease YdiL (CAAX protease family)